MARITTSVLSQKLDDFIGYQKETNNEIKQSFKELKDNIKIIKDGINGDFKRINERCLENISSFNESNINQDNVIRQLIGDVKHLKKKENSGVLKSIINLLK